MTARSFTLDQLRLSPLNVRTNEEDANATSALEASIEEDGLIFPLIVHPMDDGIHGVLDGGRRFRAISRLIETGRLVPDWPIDCVVRDVDPGRITKLSLIGNLLRRDLRPYEVHAAIAKAHERGASVEEIAASIGQRAKWVRQQMRLGRLAPEIFLEYAEERVNYDQAAAYAATEDQDLQRAAFAHFRRAIGQRHDATNIRAFLKVGDREGERLLAFVGPVIYRAAGGRYELDLFADGPERGRITDEELLRKLSEEKLGQLRAALRLRAGRDDLHFLAEPPQYGGMTDFSLELQPAEVKAGGALATMLPAGDIAATLTIDDNGEALGRWWWASRKAKAAANGPPPKPVPATAAADAATPPAQRAPIDDNPRGHSVEALNVARTLRREILRALLVIDAGNNAGWTSEAVDYLVWARLRQVMCGDPLTVTGLLGEPDAIDLEPGGVARAHLQGSEAHRIWMTAVEETAAQPFITGADPAVAFTAFATSSLQVRAVGAAVLAGLQLARSANTPGLRMAAHDRLAQRAGATDAVIAPLARPTPEFLGLFSKIERLALIQPHVDAGELRGLGRLRDRDLSRAIADRLAQLDWVHPLLSFEPAHPEPVEGSAPADAEARTEEHA